MMKVLGIDEAARGPVIGSLFLAGVMINEGDEKKLGAVKDSKLLPHKVRIQLSKTIMENSQFKIIEVPPKEIDAAVESKEGMNLNWLEAHKQAEIINKLNPDKAIIDCPSINCKAYEAYLRKLIKNKNIILVVEHKADVNYPVCSAASILAKVEREDQMDKIKAKYGDVGAGYPGHPQTIKFLKENWNKYPHLFRKSWSTYQKVANSSSNLKNQKKLGEF